MRSDPLEVPLQAPVFPQLPTWRVLTAASGHPAVGGLLGEVADQTIELHRQRLGEAVSSCLRQLDQPSGLVSQLSRWVTQRGGYLNLVAGPSIDQQHRLGWELRLLLELSGGSRPSFSAAGIHSIVSSRVGRKYSRQHDWLDGLYGRVLSLPPDAGLLSVVGTATAPFVEVAAAMRRAWLVRVKPPRTRSPSEWLRRALRRTRKATQTAGDSKAVRRPASQPADLVVRIDLSPPLDCCSIDGSRTRSLHWLSSADRDWVHVAWAQQAMVLRSRNGGTIERIVKALCGLQYSVPHGPVPVPRIVSLQPDASPRVIGAAAIGAEIGASQPSTHLRDHGPKTIGPAEQAEGASPSHGTLNSYQQTAEREWPRCIARRLPEPWSQRSCLIHCTRGNSGRFPDETQDSFLRSLLVDRNARYRSPLDVLLRIGRQLRLLGSELAIGGGHSVVCLSEVDPDECLPRPVWRRHRCRWDALPLGIGFDRQELARRGARPVRYVAPAELECIPSAERWMYQPSTTQSDTGRIDWRAEREWRWPETLDLRSLPVSSWFAFVPSQIEVRQLEAVFGSQVLSLVATESA